MRAIHYSEYGQAPVLLDLPRPSCPNDGVVVQVAATGVCRSDLHAWKGHDPVPLPMVPGHELAGIIDEVGPDVTRGRVGDRVTVPFVSGCGHCEVCGRGDAQVCPDQRQPGFTDNGSFAEFVALVAADTNLVAIPDGLDMVTAASLGCRFATAFRALHVHGRVQPDDLVAIFGCGGAGLAAVMIAKALGARIVAVDISDAALAKAVKVGADVAINSNTANPVAQIQDLGGANVSIDALGRPETARASVLSLRRRGRHIQVGLLLGEAANGAIPMDRVVAHELEIYGSHGMPAAEYPAMLDLIASGALRPQDLIGATISLDQAGEALMALDQPATTVGMTVVEIPGVDA
ncbi:zinc-dependent alcohol dehydrogenase family protein [Ornithinimicrobium sp. Arc0846-15]|nr:zinc-dependent alcohol dehydrogenase family protein [Ornithinimicrobium laminariae]